MFCIVSFGNFANSNDFKSSDGLIFVIGNEFYVKYFVFVKDIGKRNSMQILHATLTYD